jgi:hypothetical protein
VVSKNEDMTSAGQVVADLHDCISTATSAVDKKIKTYAKASEKTAASVTKAIVKQSDSAAAASLEASSAVSFASESIHAGLETQQTAIAEMKSAVAAHVNMFQELAASFVEQQSSIMSKLQDSVARHVDALKEQQMNQQKVLDDLKQQHAATADMMKLRVMDALSHALGEGFALQADVVNRAAVDFKTSAFKAAEASETATASIRTVLSMSSDASGTFVKACTPVAQDLNSVTARLYEQNAETAAAILSQATAAADAAASASKSVSSATKKLTEVAESAASDASASLEKIVVDVEKKLKASFFNKTTFVFSKRNSNFRKPRRALL